MNRTVTFEWTPEIGRCASHACTKATTGRLWFFLMAGLILTPIGLLDYLRTEETRSIGAAVTGLYCVGIYLFRKAMIRRSVRDLDRVIIDPKTELAFKDDVLVFTTDDSTVNVRWDQVTRLRRLDGFMILFSGKLLRAVIPEQFLSAEQIAFVEGCCRASQQDQVGQHGV